MTVWPADPIQVGGPHGFRHQGDPAVRQAGPPQGQARRENQTDLPFGVM